MIVAILSSTVLTQGTFECREAPIPADLTGMPSYVGHPDTAALLTRLGAAPQLKGALFGGLEVGQSFLAVPLANPDRSVGWTVDTCVASLDQIRAKLVTRIA